MLLVTMPAHLCATESDASTDLICMSTVEYESDTDLIISLGAAVQSGTIARARLRDDAQKRMTIRQIAPWAWAGTVLVAFLSGIIIGVKIEARD